MIQILLVGFGEAGQRHLSILKTLHAEARVVGVVDPLLHVPCVDHIPVYPSPQIAAAASRADLAVIATPPSTTLSVALALADHELTLLLEKPVSLRPAHLTSAVQTTRLAKAYVAFQTHFAPGISELLEPTGLVGAAGLGASIELRWRRDAEYFAGWRGMVETGGGVLFQHAIHSIALALRFWPESDTVRTIVAATRRSRATKEIEDRVTMTATTEQGRSLVVDARIDADPPAVHSLSLFPRGSKPIVITGENLELGVAKPSSAQPSGQARLIRDGLRREMYLAIFAMLRGGELHPSLYPVAQLARPLGMIEEAYRVAIHNG